MIGFIVSSTKVSLPSLSNKFTHAMCAPGIGFFWVLIETRCLSDLISFKDKSERESINPAATLQQLFKIFEPNKDVGP